MNQNSDIARLVLTLETGTAGKRTFVFEDRFLIGRHADCQVRIEDSVVSRRHAEISRENGQWYITDLKSANGVFIDGARIDRAALNGHGRFQLGSAGPVISFTVEIPSPQVPLHTIVETKTDGAKSASERTATLDHYKSHYFGKDEGEAMGEHTLMVRRAFAEVQKKQRITYWTIIGLVVVLLIITGGIALHKHRQVVKQRKLAAEVFYTMQALEIDLIKLKTEAEKYRTAETSNQIQAVEHQKEKLERSYSRYVESLEIYRKGLNEREKIILRMARRFGECEINMPEGFVKEVTAYIQKWQSSQRFATVIQRAKRQRYIPLIVRSLAEQQLPPQFIYLGLQESNLNNQAVGPPTRFGIAKGMWQFIPQTAEQYGLRTGPLKDEPVADSEDERHDIAKSTSAAARYLKDIYTTDAQASGLLVMASYNWGERRVLQLIRSMPANPRERNFWQLITKYRDKIPEETYDYVFSIFSAAVIGENPRLFGFDLDNPLALLNPRRG